jgi:hypothetical protein
MFAREERRGRFLGVARVASPCSAYPYVRDIRVQILSPRRGDIVDSGKGLSYRPASLHKKHNKNLATAEMTINVVIVLQAIPFGHVRFERSSDWIPAMEVSCY